MRNLPACAMVLAAALIALTTGCQTAPPPEPQTHWGAERNGLTAGIRSSTDETVPGEAVEFTFYLRNVSGSPATVLRPDNGTVVWYYDGKTIRAHPGRPDQTMVLEPGDSAEYTARHAWMRPGTYTVRAELRPRTKETAVEGLQSGEATVTVAE